MVARGVVSSRALVGVGMVALGQSTRLFAKLRVESKHSGGDGDLDLSTVESCWREQRLGSRKEREASLGSGALGTDAEFTQKLACCWSYVFSQLTSIRECLPHAETLALIPRQSDDLVRDSVSCGWHHFSFICIMLYMYNSQQKKHRNLSRW